MGVRLRQVVRLRAVPLAVVVLMSAASYGTALATTAPVTKIFKSTGAQQRYTVPAGTRLVAVLVQGAWGGAFGGGPGAYAAAFGQNGAAFQGILAVTPGQTLYVDVGSNGTPAGGPTFGGGGAAGSTDPEGAIAASGGGATDVRASKSLQSRMLVAGGAGGNGGGGVTAGAGLACRAGGGGASATNEQPIPKGNPSVGPTPIKTSAGYVIPGLATGDDHTVMTSAGITDAGGGSTVAGKGGTGSSCQGGGAYQANTYSGSVAGSSASGADGGAGGNAAGLKPQPCGTPGKCNNAGPGGGGGGGYFGGGGGVSGFNTCNGPGSGGCGTTGGFGGGSGSSFVSDKVLYPSPAIIGAMNMGVPFAWVAPILAIQSPANGAVYRAGQVVHASWACSEPPGWGYGVQNCTATTPSGSAIDTKPGRHTFTVHGIAQNPSEPISVSVTYTVR